MKNRFCLSSTFILTATLVAGAPDVRVRVNAVYVPPDGAGGEGAVEARFAVLDPRIVVNETPPPRLELDPGQAILIDRQPPPRRRGSVDPTRTKYLDLAKPVRFPVALAPDAAQGTHSVGATIVYYYCSKREEWCRKDRSKILLQVVAP